MENLFAAAVPAGASTTAAPPRPSSAVHGVVVTLASTGELQRGVRADASASLSPHLPTTEQTETVIGARPERDSHALLPTWAVPALPSVAAQADPSVLPGQAAVREAPSEDLTGLIPAEALTAPAILPGTPNLVAGLSALDTRETTEGRVVSPKLNILVLGSLFAVGLWGFGQFRDSLTVASEPRTPPALRDEEEEEDK
jgi:hypothetical protein